MARYTGPVCRLCRRESMKLFLKGTRCFLEKCAMTKRDFAPGQHKTSRTKLSNYGLQLREKQKVKRMYGILERQFRKYFEIAARTKGVTGKILLQLLESRLDNVIFRMGLALSRSEARQIVRHDHVFVNSKKVNIPSFLIKANDIITVKGKDKFIKSINDNIELTKDRTCPTWLETDIKNLSAKVLRLPEKEDINLPIEEQLIIELYSK